MGGAWVERSTSIGLFMCTTCLIHIYIPLQLEHFTLMIVSFSTQKYMHVFRTVQNYFSIINYTISDIAKAQYNTHFAVAYPGFRRGGFLVRSLLKVGAN